MGHQHLAWRAENMAQPLRARITRIRKIEK